MTLGERLDGVRILMRDVRNELNFAWFGGHGVHVYDDDGHEVDFWNTGDFARNDASTRDIRASMRRRLKVRVS